MHSSNNPEKITGLPGRNRDAQTAKDRRDKF